MSSKIEQFDIATVIPVGHNNAVSRKYLIAQTGMSDRMVRRAIELSKAPIVNLGYGYFVADENDPVDRNEARAYCAQERARVQAIAEKMAVKFGNFEMDVTA